jgi:hypothetical protein
MEVVCEYVILPDMEVSKSYYVLDELPKDLQFMFSTGLIKVVYTYSDHYELFYLEELEFPTVTE